MTRKYYQPKLNEIYLFIIPLFLLTFLILLRIEYHAFYVASFDPTYSYLFNGLNLARGTLEIGQTDHPGTPLQMLAAVVIRIVYFLNGKGDITRSLLENPEMYLAWISNVLIAWNVMVIFLFGYFYYKKTGNIREALFLQLMPFITQRILLYMPLVMTEALYTGFEIFFILTCFNYIYSKKEKNFKYSIYAGVFGGIMIATKISVLPVLIIPVILFRKYLEKVIYLLSIVLSFVIFTFPIIHEYGHFFNWLFNIFTHAGNYGSGAAKIIVPSLFIEHLKSIFTNDILFTVLFVVLLFFGGFFIYHRKKLKGLPAFRFYLAICVASVFHILLVAKHYSPHYLIPVQLLFLPAVILIFRLLEKILPAKYLHVIQLKNSRNLLLIVVLLFLGIRDFIKISFSPHFVPPQLKTVQCIQNKIKHSPVIVELSPHTPNVFIQGALYFGTSFSGDFKNEYLHIIDSLYPNTYFYIPPQKRIFNWLNNYDIRELLLKHRNIYIFYESDKVVNPRLISEYPFIINHEVFRNNKTKTNISRLSLDSSDLKNVTIKIDSVFCDMETITTDSKYFLGKDTLNKFEKGWMQNADRALSGKFSAKHSKDVIYGPDHNMKVTQGDYFKISVWHFPAGLKSFIVASADDPKDFYRASDMSGKKSNGWEAIHLNFTIPPEINDSTINIFIWTPKGNDVYFDDFHIKRYRFNFNQDK